MVDITVVFLGFMVDISMVYGRYIYGLNGRYIMIYLYLLYLTRSYYGFINQRSHHWGRAQPLQLQNMQLGHIDPIIIAPVIGPP